MSKTYNSKHDFNKNLEADEVNAYIKSTRHPNKRKNKALSREFAEVGLCDPSEWRYRYGEEHYKSSRMHLAKRVMTEKRRNRLKNKTEKEINREIELLLL